MQTNKNANKKQMQINQRNAINKKKKMQTNKKQMQTNSKQTKMQTKNQTNANEQKCKRTKCK